jgi:hypothetical protein
MPERVDEGQARAPGAWLSPVCRSRLERLPGLNASFGALPERLESAVMLTDPQPQPVLIRDTSLRDGLQSIGRTVPTEVKRAWLRGAIAGWLDGEPLHGAIWRVGLPKTMRPHAAA